MSRMRLVANIATEMTLAASHKGVEIQPVSLYKSIWDALTESERCIQPEVIDSIGALHWAVLISHARNKSIPMNVALTEVLREGMLKSAYTLSQMQPSKPSIPKGKKRRHLRLIK
jgi:hypothetical protein